MIIYELLFNTGMLIIFIYCIFYMIYTAPDPIPNTMGSEVWPLMVLALLVLLITINIINILKKSKEIKDRFKLKLELVDILKNKLFIAMAILSIYCLILEFIGFIPSTLLLCLCSIKLIGQKRKWVILTGAVVITMLIYFIFSWSLMVPLPRGYGIFREFSLLLERVH